MVWFLIVRWCSGADEVRTTPWCRGWQNFGVPSSRSCYLVEVRDWRWWSNWSYFAFSSKYRRAPRWPPWPPSPPSFSSSAPSSRFPSSPIDPGLSLSAPSTRCTFCPWYCFWLGYSNWTTMAFQPEGQNTHRCSMHSSWYCSVCARSSTSIELH